MASSIPVSQRPWVRFPFKSEFFQVSSFQPLRLKHLHCDDLHIILVVLLFERFLNFVFSLITTEWYLT